jgi:hypothetical protein
VPLQRFTAHAGAIEVGYVEYDGGNRMWVWSSRLADDAWGWGSTAEAAKHGLEAWLRRWLENFRPLLGRPPQQRSEPGAFALDGATLLP